MPSRITGVAAPLVLASAKKPRSGSLTCLRSCWLCGVGSETDCAALHAGLARLAVAVPRASDAGWRSTSERWPWLTCSELSAFMVQTDHGARITGLVLDVAHSASVLALSA